ncbi:arginine--tRNA ligase [Pelagibacteraceae bacterium]|nr:arginine--tRNA ligase [Pelagibacteraceae bacterium]
MNIFEKFLINFKSQILENKNKLNLNNLNEFKGVVVEKPPVEFNFDLSCNISLILAKLNNQNPRELAIKIKSIFEKNSEIDKIEIAGPGFLNIKLTNDSLIEIIKDIIKSKNNYGSKKNNKKYNIEFVSANPTGPMHVGHCRGAIYGDVLANLLKFNGNSVVKEYYINDYGNQIINFTKSVFLRIKEIKFKEKFKNEENLYPGDYIIEIAKKIINDNIKIDYDNFKKSYPNLSKESLSHSMNMIKSDLKMLGISHDKFFSESMIVNNNLVDKSVEILKNNKFVENGYLEPPKGEEIKNWKKTKRLIFKSTLFGDDTNRALQKNDGSWTYFANDVAYHSDKIRRNYDYLINILGADHTGYIKRITSAVEALSKNKVKLECRVCQLVKLFKKGKPYKMSKRAGDFISVNDLLKEVDKDSIRFMMLNRSNDVELDFDFDKVLEKTKDNPVFYVQYCYARINSLFNSLNINLNDKIDMDEKNFELNIYELKILRKIFDWPKVIETASNKYEPHRLPFYLYELATLFHSYWSVGNVNDKYKFINNGKINSMNTFVIIKTLSIVIENGMNILGVSLPKKM